MSSLFDGLPALHAGPECDAELVPWRLAAGLRLTAIAKIAFSLQPGEIKALLPRESIIDRDRHRDRSPQRSLEEASDLAPLIPGAEVLVVGHAYAPRGLARPVLTTQLQIARKGEVQLLKRIQVVGDRRDAQAQPQPFQRMPLVWERALRSSANPVGMDPNLGLPNLLHPDNPHVAASFGPIAPTWPARQVRLKVARSVLDAEPLDLPAGFDFTYYRAAPDDQQLSSLKGSEWVALDGLHPAAPRLEFRLPGALIVARLVQPRGRPLKILPLLPDRLVIDTDRQIGTLTYRAGFAVDWTKLADHRVEVGVSKQDETLRFPDVTDPSTLRGRWQKAPAPAPPATQITPQQEVADPALPFPRSGAVVSAAPAPIPISVRDPDLDTTLDIPAPPGSGAGSSAGAGPIASAASASSAFPALPTSPSSPVAPPPSAPEMVPKPQRGSVPASLGHTMMVNAEEAGRAPVPFAGAIAPSEGSRPGTTEGLPFHEREVEQLPEPPSSDERTGDAVPTVSDNPLAVTTFPWQLKPPQDVLVVIVKGSFELVRGAHATFRDEPELPLGDIFVDDELDKALVHASDFAVLKPEVDVLVRGTAYAPSGQSSAMQIVIRLRGAHGSIDRAIAVFGDRVWQRGALQMLPSKPEPFESIPLSYERAFGGPEFEGNPAGVGHRGAPGADGVRRLPNFEELGKLISSPSDTPAPAGVGPIHPLWPARSGMLGTYDTTWFKTRWPYYPQDFAYRYFQSAPPAQRIRVIEGEEEYELIGLHPSEGAIRGRLPGLRVRAFAQRAKQSAEGFSEIPLKIDTITFAPDENAVHIVWRGFLEVTADDAPDLAHVFATSEPLAGPALSLDEARARYLGALEEPPDEVVEDMRRPPPAEDEPDPDAAEVAAIEQELARVEAESLAMYPPPAPGEEPPIEELTAEELAMQMRAGGASEEEIAELTAALQPEGTEPPPPPDVDLRKLVLQRIEEGESLEDLDLAGADLSDLDLSAQSFERTNLSGANLDRANLTSSDASGANFSGASLQGTNLDQALLTEADLSDANLAGARLTKALLDRIEARGLKARGADFTEAMLAEAVLAEADLSAAKLDRADLSEADLSGALLDGASFKEATMPALRLYDVRGEGATFDRAEMINARAEGATLTESSFRDVMADDSVWERATLSSSTFHGASLRDCSFTKASCHKTVFSQADLGNGRLQKSKMLGASFLRANLMDANCDRASLEGADLRGANLHGASLVRASLKNAQLDGAITTSSDLDRRQPS